jgi:hypothetical protein
MGVKRGIASQELLAIGGENSPHTGCASTTVAKGYAFSH